MIAATRSIKSRMSTHCMGCRCQCCQERHDSHSHWMEWCFIHLENRHSEIRFNSVGQSPMAGRSHPRAGRWSTCTPLVCRQRTPLPPLAKDIAVGLARCHITHMCRQNKGVHIKPRTGKDSPKWGHEGFLAPHKEMFQAQGTLLCSHARV